MLVLTRKSEQSVVIGRNIEIKVLSIHGDQVSLGFSAPDEVSIYRKEVYDAIQKQNKEAVMKGDGTLKKLSSAFPGLFVKKETGNTQQKGESNNHETTS
jgi:carbon storage regulator